MNFANGPLYIEKLRSGVSEAEIVQAFGTITQSYMQLSLMQISRLQVST